MGKGKATLKFVGAFAAVFIVSQMIIGSMNLAWLARTASTFVVLFLFFLVYNVLTRRGRGPGGENPGNGG